MDGEAGRSTIIPVNAGTAIRAQVAADFGRFLKNTVGTPALP
jgi:hypothetical protein